MSCLRNFLCCQFSFFGSHVSVWGSMFQAAPSIQGVEKKTVCVSDVHATRPVWRNNWVANSYFIFFCPSPLPFGGSTVLSLTRRPAGNRTTIGSLSATSRTPRYQLSHEDDCKQLFLSAVHDARNLWQNRLKPYGAKKKARKDEVRPASATWDPWGWWNRFNCRCDPICSIFRWRNARRQWLAEPTWEVWLPSSVVFLQMPVSRARCL